MLQFSPASMMPPMFRTHLRLHTAVVRRTSGRRVGRATAQTMLVTACFVAVASPQKVSVKRMFTFLVVRVT